MSHTDHRPFRIQVVSASKATLSPPSWPSLEQTAPLSADQAPLSDSPGVPSLAASLAPQVQLITVSEKVSKIIVTCSCGQRIEIECES